MRRFLNSLKNALRGLRSGWKERNLRIHLLVLPNVIAGGLLLGLSNAEWLAVVIASGLVIASELLNTAIEKLTDLIHPERHPLAGKVKDISAAAVLISALSALAVAAIVMYRHL